MSEQKINCPFCSSRFMAPKEHIKNNGRVFCGNCCKSFDCELEDEIDLSQYIKHLSKAKEEKEEELNEESEVVEASETEEELPLEAAKNKSDKQKLQTFTELEDGLDEGYYLFKMTEL